ncbi:MAG: HlyD family efflux transporter periplasmic adaptor subunit, partial [Turicibacter sp.]|nr:HlyD family efflux transporter periplasmic adaptor subunit [Turicibacter sp.]
FFAVTSRLPRTQIATAQGSVVVLDSVFVSPLTDGVLIEMYHASGDFVEIGDVLFILSSGGEGLQQQTFATQIGQQRLLLDAMDLFSRSLDEGRNLLSNSGIEQEYYARMEFYLQQVGSEAQSTRHLNEDLNRVRQNLRETQIDIERLGREINNLRERESDLQGRIQNSPIAFSPLDFPVARLYNGSEWYGDETFDDQGEGWYSDEPLDVELVADSTEEVVIDEPIPPVVDEIISLPDSEGDSLRQELSEVRMEISNLESRRSGYESKVESFESEIRQLERQLESTGSGQTRFQLLSELGSQRTAAEVRIADLQGQMEAQRAQDSFHEIHATQTGYLHYLTPLRPGMTLQRMQTIAEISQNREEHMQIEAFIQARDISRVAVGQEVRVALDGVNIQKFGTLEGRLEFIDVGTIMQETPQGNLLFYRGVVTIDETRLQARNGDYIQLLRSMPVSARIVYNRETYLDWMLGLLNFSD